MAGPRGLGNKRPREPLWGPTRRPRLACRPGVVVPWDSASRGAAGARPAVLGPSPSRAMGQNAPECQSFGVSDLSPPLSLSAPGRVALTFSSPACVIGRRGGIKDGAAGRGRRPDGQPPRHEATPACVLSVQQGHIYLLATHQEKRNRLTLGRTDRRYVLVARGRRHVDAYQQRGWICYRPVTEQTHLSFPRPFSMEMFLVVGQFATVSDTAGTVPHGQDWGLAGLGWAEQGWGFARLAPCQPRWPRRPRRPRPLGALQASGPPLN